MEWAHNLWRSSFWPGGPAPQRKCAGVVIHDSKKVEGVRQQEEQEDKRDEEIGDEMNGEVEESLNVRMKHDDDAGVNNAQT